jgi:hypothetical protein
LNYVYVSSQAAAYEYGRAIYAILSGMANGKSITTELRNLPSEPMGTLYLEAAGTVGRFRANGTTFAFDSQGLIAGCDAMLDGGAGKLTGASGTDWFPLMVSASGLPTVTPVANSTPGLANTINAPSGFDPMAPGSIWASFGTAGVEGDVYAVELTRSSVVPAMQENVRRESVSRSLGWVLEAPYSLTSVVETGTSVAVSFGTLRTLYELMVGSGSGVIADLSAATTSGGYYAFTGGTTTTFVDLVGWIFTVSSSKVIKGVGFYDHQQNGLTGGYSIYLEEFVNPANLGAGSIIRYFDAADQIDYLDVTNSSTLNDVWRRVDLTTTGATLTTGKSYLLFAERISGTADQMIKNATTVNIAANVNYLQNYNANSGGGTTSADGIGYFGPMIFFVE